METSTTISVIDHQASASDADLLEATASRPSHPVRRARIVGISALIAIGAVAVSATRHSSRSTVVDDHVAVPAAEPGILLDGERFATAIDRAVRDLPPPVTPPSVLLDGEAFERAVRSAIDDALRRNSD